MMSSGINRRAFVSGVAGTSVAALSAGKLAGQEAKPVHREKKYVRPNFIAVSTYSYWRYRDDSKLGIEECIDLAADAGFDGVEILHVQMQDQSQRGPAEDQAACISEWLGLVWVVHPSVLCKS